MVNSSKKILVAHGCNLDLLGQRDPNQYGQHDLVYLNKLLATEGPRIGQLAGLNEVQLECRQTNVESEYLHWFDEAWDGIVLNPAAWTHTSLAIADRLAAKKIPYVEVHLSNLAGREAFRQRSFSAPGAIGIVQGARLDSYLAGLQILCRYLAGHGTGLSS